MNSRSILHIMVGMLDGKPSKSHLFYCSDLEESACSKNVLAHFEKSLNIIFKNNINYDNIKAIITDSAKYCQKFFNDFKSKYSLTNIFHIKCLAHIIHIICNNIRLKYKIIDKFFTILNKFFISNIIKNKFKIFSKLSIPPKIIRTRWCSFLDLATYIFNNFNKIKRFLYSKLNINSYLLFLRNCLAQKRFKKDLSIINNYSFLSIYLKQLQDPNLCISKSFDIIEDIKNRLNNQDLLNKFDELITSNSGLTSIFNLSKNDKDLSYCLSNSIDVEKSFSHLQKIVKNRPRLSIENIRKHLIIQLNHNKL